MSFPPQLLLGTPVGTTAGWVLGQLAVVYPTDADFTLTTSGASPQSTNNALQVTSGVSLTATRKLIAPLSFGQQYTVQNNTTGGQTIQIIGPSGTGVLVPNGETITAVCDGTNFIPQSGGGAASIIFRPGGVDGNGVVTTWAGVEAAIAAGATRVIVDSTIGAAQVPAGVTTNVAGVTFAGFINQPTAPMTLEIVDTAVLQHLNFITDGLVVYVDAATTQGLVYNTFDSLQISQRASLQSDPGAAVPAAIIGQHTRFTLIVDTDGTFFTGGSGQPLFFCTAPRTSAFQLFTTAYAVDQFDPQAIQGTIALVWVADNASVQGPGLPPFNITGAGSSQAIGRTLQAAWLIPSADTTANRPQSAYGALQPGQMYFDTTLGYPIWWNGSAWVNAGTTTNLVWAPGGTAGPNVFTTWATLYAAISALPTGTFYTVTVSTTHGAATVPAGTYHLGTGKFIGQTGWELLTGASGAVADFLNLTFENFGNIIGVAGGGGIHSNGNFLEGDAGSSGLATITFRSCLIQNLSGAGATLIDGGAAVSCVFDNSAVVGANAVFSNPNGNGLSLTAVNQSQVPITAQGTAGQVQWDPTSIVTPASTWLASTGAGFTSTGVAVVIRIPIALITVLSIANIPAGAIVLRAFLDVTTPYSGGTTIELGTAANASLFMTTAQNTPTSANLYDKPQDTVNTTADPLLVTIAGGPGAGAGFACVEYCIPLT